MARIPVYVWDIGLALALFWLYLELKNLNLVSAEERQQWQAYQQRQQQLAQQQQQPSSPSGGGSPFDIFKPVLDFIRIQTTPQPGMMG